MTIQHTPGPWNVSHNAGEQMGGWKTNPYSVVVHPKGVHRTTVANIPERATISEKQKKANAYLIASAPDLLAALIECKDIIDHCLFGCDAENAAAKACAAISKAMGEQI
jgi:hypothetical protein